MKLISCLIVFVSFCLSLVASQDCGEELVSYDQIATVPLFIQQQQLKTLDYILTFTSIVINITNYATAADSTANCPDFWVFGPCDSGVLAILLNFGSVDFDAPLDSGKFLADYVLFVSRCQNNGPYLVTFKSCGIVGNCPDSAPTSSPTSCDPNYLSTSGFNTLLDGYSVISVEQSAICINFPISFFNESIGDTVSVTAFLDRQSSNFPNIFESIPLDRRGVLNGTIPVECTTTTATTAETTMLNRKVPTRKTKNPTVAPTEGSTETPSEAPSRVNGPATTSLPSELPSKRRRRFI